MQDFPYSLEPLLLDRELRLPKGPQRKLVTLRLVMRQLLEALAAAHNTGRCTPMVHMQRGVTPFGSPMGTLLDCGILGF